jgi:hypothetical protein
MLLAVLVVAVVVICVVKTNYAIEGIRVTESAPVLTCIGPCYKQVTFFDFQVNKTIIDGVYRRKSKMTYLGMCDADMCFEHDPNGYWVIDAEATFEYQKTRRIPRDELIDL